jgi:hypothetical protein
MASRKKSNKVTASSSYVPEFKDTLEGYIHEDNRKFSDELIAPIKRADNYLIHSTFAFGSCGLLHVMNTSGTIRRLDLLLESRLGNHYDDGGHYVGSTGSPRKDYKKLLELVVSAAYAIGVLRGVKLEGASDERIAHIRSFARL